MDNKHIIIDGDKFQKEYKDQYKKDLVFSIILGVILIVLAASGLFGSKLLLKIGIVLFPVLMIIYATNLLTIGLSMYKKYKHQARTYFLQALLVALIAIYIIINPIETLNWIIILVGIFIIASGLVKMLYFPGYIPVLSFVGGGLLILFSNIIIEFIYFIVLIILFGKGISLLYNSITKIKNK